MNGLLAMTGAYLLMAWRWTCGATLAIHAHEQARWVGRSSQLLSQRSASANHCFIAAAHGVGHARRASR